MAVALEKADHPPVLATTSPQQFGVVEDATRVLMFFPDQDELFDSPVPADESTGSDGFEVEVGSNIEVAGGGDIPPAVPPTISNDFEEENDEEYQAQRQRSDLSEIVWYNNPMDVDREGMEFLKGKYGLHTKPEVVQAAKRTERHTHTTLPNDPLAGIQNYLSRFSEIIDRPDPKKRERGISALKKILIENFVVRVEDIPDSYWQSQMRMVRNRGQSGDWQDLSEAEALEIKKDYLSRAKEDQRGSLEEWVDYLATEKSSYLPSHLKYWAFRSMLKLERYGRGEEGKPGRFPARPSGRQRSVKMFPEVNERGLMFIAKAFRSQADNQSIHFRYDIPDAAKTEFQQHLAKKDFRSLYEWTQEYIPPISEEEMQTTDGQWIIYPQGSTAEPLSKTLQGKGSGWCIAGSELAHQYLQNGNLNIYYTRDKEGAYTIPRVVIVQTAGRVTEVRGIEWEENVDGYIKETKIIGDKLHELPGGEEFYEIDADTKRLTTIDRKIAGQIALEADDIRFLYEVDRPIKYFGYKKDPRIAELRASRNPKDDVPVVLECQPDQIAWRQEDIRADTKAYVGPLFSGIRERLPNDAHIYISFPEGRIEREAFESLEIGGKTRKELGQQMRDQNIQINLYERGILESSDFTTLLKPEVIDLVRLTVANLGFTDYATTEQLFAKIKEFGLELVPAETGHHYRLAHMDQPVGDRVYMGMNPISDRYGDPRVFFVVRLGDERWLNYYWARSDYPWPPKYQFVFRLRPGTKAKLGAGQAS